MLGQYNMPESFLSRPSEARASLGNPARSASMRENTRTRQDATLMRTSSRNTVEPSRPESSRQPPRIDFSSTHNQHLEEYSRKLLENYFRKHRPLLTMHETMMMLNLILTCHLLTHL